MSLPSPRHQPQYTLLDSFFPNAFTTETTDPHFKTNFKKCYSSGPQIFERKNETQCHPVGWRCISYAGFQSECQALIWKLDPYTSLSVAARTTSTFLSSLCRKEFSVMGMSPRPFFTNKKASGNGRGLERQLGQSDSAHTSITNTLHPWNHPVEISLTLSHFPTLFPINQYSWHSVIMPFFFF